MESIVVWIIIIIGWAILKGVFSKSDEEVIAESVRENP